MRFIYLFFLILLSSTVTTSAQSGTLIGGSAANGIDMNTVPYGRVTSFGLVEKTTTGSNYLFETWRIGSIITEQGEIKNCPLNIDLKNHLVEINTDKGVKTLSAGRIKQLIVESPGTVQQVFENSKNYDTTSGQLAGFVEVLVSDEVKLLKHYYSVVQEGSYNAALDMGNNETKILVKSKYYLSGNQALVEIPSARKKFLKLFPKDKQEEIDAFLQEEKLSLKDRASLIAVCNFINSEHISLNNVN